AAAFLGVPLGPEDIAGFLSSIGLEKRGADQAGIVFSIPTWRPDLEREADLFEEVARLYGYNRVPEILPCCPLGNAIPSRKEGILSRIREFFCGRGLDEVNTYSFLGARNLENLGLPPGHPLREAPAILNPVNKEQNLLRTTLIPGLLEVTGLNQRRKAADIRCFETGAVFQEAKDGGKPLEKCRLAAVLAPGKALSHWSGDSSRPDFFSIKGLVEDLCAHLKIAAARYLPVEDPIFQPGQAAALWLGDFPAGVVGAVSDPVVAASGLEGPVFLAELDLDRLLGAAHTERKYSRLPEYPAVERDIALLVDRELPYGKVAEILDKLRPPALESYTLFDIYTGDQVPADKKSLAIHLIYRSPDGTLDDKMVSSLHDPLITELLGETRGRLR
ncbi:MAG TPA: hypothetical protein PK636_04255, partial [bacterium]|nr:hypothetical protein [bacterium]